MATPGQARKVFPAYGKALAEARRQGLVPRLPGDGRLLVSVGWLFHEAAQAAGTPHVVVMTDRRPADFILGFLAGLPLTVVYEAADELVARDLVAELLHVRPASVVSQCYVAGRDAWLFYRRFESPADLGRFSLYSGSSHV